MTLAPVPCPENPPGRSRGHGDNVLPAAPISPCLSTPSRYVSRPPCSPAGPHISRTWATPSGVVGAWSSSFPARADSGHLSAHPQRTGFAVLMASARDLASSCWSCQSCQQAATENRPSRGDPRVRHPASLSPLTAGDSPLRHSPPLNPPVWGMTSPPVDGYTVSTTGKTRFSQGNQGSAR